MYVNGKMRPVEIVPGGYIVRTFVNATIYSPQHNIKKKKRKQNLKKICLS
jgi:hypothetical protein